MSLIEKIKNNDITKLHLTWNDEEILENWSAACKVLKDNTSILTVILDDEFLGCLRHDARSQFLASLADLSNLQELSLQDALVQIDDVAKILNKVKGLKVLTLKSLVFQGLQKEFDATETSIKVHPSLKELKIENCGPAIDSVDMSNLKLGATNHGGTIDENSSTLMNPAAA